MKKQVFLVFPVVYNVQDLYHIHWCIEILPKNVFCLIYESDGRRIKFSGIGLFLRVQLQWKYTFVWYEKAEMCLSKVWVKPVYKKLLKFCSSLWFLLWTLTEVNLFPWEGKTNRQFSFLLIPFVRWILKQTRKLGWLWWNLMSLIYEWQTLRAGERSQNWAPLQQ